MRSYLCALAIVLVSAHASSKEIVVGQVVPLTDAQRVGLQLQSGIQLYFEWVNRSGGINGNTLKLVTKNREQDSGGNVKSNTPKPDAKSREEKGLPVAIATQELIDEAKPIALIGLMGTGSMATLLRENVLSQAGIPVVGIRTGASALHSPVHPLLFHTRASYAAEAEKAVTYLATIGYRRFAVFAENSPFGKDGGSHFASAIEKRGLSLVAQGGYELGATNAMTGISEAVRLIDAAKPDAILAVGNSGAVADFYKGYRQHNKGTPLITLSTVDPGAVLKRIGKESAHGLGIARVVPDPLNRRTAIAREFQDIGRKIRGEKFERTQAELEGFIAAKVLVDALKRCGSDPKSSTLKAELEKTKAFDIGGFLIGFSPKDHSGSKFVDVGIIGSEGRMLQ